MASGPLGGSRRKTFNRPDSPPHAIYPYGRKHSRHWRITEPLKKHSPDLYSMRYSSILPDLGLQSKTH